MEASGSWCLIDSDPAVFTHLIRAFGASGVQVEELWRIWDFDDDIYKNLRPVHGLIFLFKYQEKEPPSGPVITSGEELKKIYFAHQTIKNASATQAIINLLLNTNYPELEHGKELTRLKELSKNFDPYLAGNAVSNSQVIRDAHNSVSNRYLCQVDKPSTEKDNEVYHFICYMPIKGRLYELDGLRAGPIDHGPLLANDDWTATAHPILRSRINKYTDGEIHFNLMAVVSDRKMVLQQNMDHLLAFWPMLSLESDEIQGEIQEEIRRLRRLMEHEDIKMRRYAQEMARRRHNCVPFMFEVLRSLAQDERFTQIVASARHRIMKTPAALASTSATGAPVKSKELKHRMCKGRKPPKAAPKATPKATPKVSLKNDTDLNPVRVYASTDSEEISQENFAQLNLSQDSLDVILPPLMLNSNAAAIPEAPPPERPESPWVIVINHPNHVSGAEDELKMEENPPLDPHVLE